MARKQSSRKYLLTINNPVDHGYTHEQIRSILSEFPGLQYWCMCDEIGEQGTQHTHIYMVSANGIMFDTMCGKFYGAHIDKANGSNQQNRDYVRKEGKWKDDAKHDTSLPDTFEEWGELPPDRTHKESQSEQIVQMIRDGMSNAEILTAIPTAYNKLTYIEQARQTLLHEENKSKFRTLNVTYLWGDTGAGKTRSVMEKYGYPCVYQVTNYDHPFDGYQGQDVIIFEEFRSSLKIEDMLKYLDGYPLMLPCRYADKVACYTKVYIISNYSLEKQYPNIQQDNPRTWSAFCRRIHNVEFMANDFAILPNDPDFEPDSFFNNTGVQ